MATMATARLVLFDLGGVVCDFSHSRRLLALSQLSGIAPEQVHERLFSSGFDLDCDRGRYTLDEQCAEIGHLLGGVYRLDELTRAWARAFVPSPEVLDVVGQVRARAMTATLTNNGPLVERMLRDCFPDVVRQFDRLCFSYQAQATKPDARAYLATLEELGIPPARSLFVDDAEQNVIGAREVGIDAVQFESVAELVNALRRRKLL
jgi:putative hydrolase of the HAD superfamily